MPVKSCDITTDLRLLRIKHRNNVFISYLNINSIRNKLVEYSALFDNYFDIFVIAETKLDSSFPTPQFILKGYKSPYRLDISCNSGGILVYVKDSISSRRLTRCIIPIDIQIIPIELNLKSHKLLLISIYRPPRQNIVYFLSNLSDIIDFYNNYDRCVIIGDFNKEPDDMHLSKFIHNYMLYNHVKFKTCWKSKKGTCIDLILSNQKYSHIHTNTIDTGLSDCHHMIYTILKSTFIKSQPSIVTYRSFKNFEKNSFLDELRCLLNQSVPTDTSEFYSLFEFVIDKHAPIIKKVIRGNNKPHLTKCLRKAIMYRSFLRNKYNKTRSLNDLIAYKKQRNYVTYLNRKAKSNYFNNAIKHQNTNSKNFWRLCKPFLKSDSDNFVKFTLVENDEVINDEIKIANIFNSHFNNVTSNLNLNFWKPDHNVIINDPILNIIERFANHPSIIKIKSKFCVNSTGFEFNLVNESHILELILTMNLKKKSGGSVSSKMLNISSNISSSFITKFFNDSVITCTFPSELKLAEIIPLHKKGEITCKNNFRPISILPTISKVFEKALYLQLNTYAEKNMFSQYLCGFRRGHNTQHALLRLLNSWQMSLDNKKFVGSILMDLSKAFDCLPHDLLIAKLHAYGFGINSLRLLYSYLSHRFHRVKIGSSFSEWLEIPLGVSQGSILGPLLFNIFINDLFFNDIVSSICNFADDNTLYVEGNSLEEVTSMLQSDISLICNWLQLNSLKPNISKFQLLFPGLSGSAPSITVDNIKIEPSDTVKLLGITIDIKLTFKTHVETLCSKVSRMINAFLRIRPYLSLKASKILHSAYIISHFNYCPLIWMFHDKSTNCYINKIHYRSLKALYQNFNSSYTDLLELDSSVTIHVKNLRSLMTEIFKCKKQISPNFIIDMFSSKNLNYNLRNKNLLIIPPAETTRYGFNSVRFQGSLLWNKLPINIKSCANVKTFKKCIKTWAGNCCNCVICK